jgi:hypothetical protein
MDWNRRMADSRGRDFLRAMEEEMMTYLLSFRTHVKGKEGRLGKNSHSITYSNWRKIFKQTRTTKLE